MNDKIKAILIQNGEPTPENPIEIKRLLVNKEAEDYITNLQQENERLNKIINELENWFKGYHKSHTCLNWYEEDYIEFIEHLESELKGSNED